MFIIDKAGPKRNIQTIGQTISQPMNQRKPMDRSKKKHIDDFTVLTNLNLKTNLVPDPNPTRPVTYRGRTEQILPPEANSLQKDALKRVGFNSNVYKYQKHATEPIKN